MDGIPTCILPLEVEHQGEQGETSDRVKFLYVHNVWGVSGHNFRATIAFEWT